MFTNLKSIAGAAIILAMLATSAAEARQVETDAPKTKTVVSQKLARTTPAPYFWLVLGVGY